MSGILLHLRIARRHKWLIGGTCLGAAILAAALSLALKPMYQATARILVLEPMIESARSPYSNVSSTIYTVDTYTSMVESQRLLARAIRKLRLDLPPDNLTARSLARMLSVIPVTDTKLIQISLRYQNPVVAKLLVNEVAGQFIAMYQELKDKEIAASQRFVKEQVDAARAQFEQSQQHLEDARQEAQIEELLGRIRAQSEEVKEYEILLTDVESRLAGERAKLGELQAQLDSIPEMVLASATEGASRLQTTGRPPDDDELAAEATALLAAIEGMWEGAEPEEGWQEARSTVRALQDVMEQRKRLRTKAGDRASRAKLVEGLDRLASLLEQLRPTRNPGPAEIRELVAKATGSVTLEGSSAVRRRNPLRERLELDLASCRAEVASLEAQRKELGAALQETDHEFLQVQERLYEGERRVAIAEMETKSLSEANLALTQKLDESRLGVAARLENLLLVDPATVPDRKVWPRRKVNVAVGAILGLMLGYAVALIVESRPGASGGAGGPGSRRARLDATRHADPRAPSPR